jgi:hypothetical protein
MLEFSLTMASNPEVLLGKDGIQIWVRKKKISFLLSPICQDVIVRFKSDDGYKIPA